MKSSCMYILIRHLTLLKLSSELLHVIYIYFDFDINLSLPKNRRHWFHHIMHCSNDNLSLAWLDDRITKGMERSVNKVIIHVCYG